MAHPACPNCGLRRSWKIRRGKRKCKKCRREFAPGRWPVAGFRMGADAWSRAADAFLRERTVRALAASCGTGIRRAHEIARAFRLAMATEAVPVFRGPVELDETYIGAQRKNQRLHLRKRYPPKRGHGTHKLPILGIFDRKSGLVRVEVEPRKLDVGFLRGVVREQVRPRARIFTDGYNAYVLLEQDGFRREWVNHDAGEYVRGDVHTNNIEGFWGIMKRRMSCIGGMRRSRLHVFAKEVAWRFNHRRVDLDGKKRALLALVFRT